MYKRVPLEYVHPIIRCLGFEKVNFTVGNFFQDLV
jgi:hypothetical protein